MSDFLGNKDKRQYVAAAVFVLLILAIFIFLTYVEVPENNKVMFTAIFSVIAGRLSVAADTLFGQGQDELNALRRRIEALEKENAVLLANEELTKQKYDSLMELIVNRINMGTSPPEGAANVRDAIDIRGD